MASLTWNGASADWSVTSDWSSNAIPGAGDDVFFNAGAFTVTIASGESFDANSLNMSGGAVAIAGTLNFTNASGVSFPVGPITIAPGGTLSGEGILFGPGPILNQGVIDGDVNINTGGQPLFITPTGTFTNQGLMLAAAGGNLDIDANKNGTFANLNGGTLTGGTYEADTTSTLAFVTPGTAPAFTVLDATLTFNGFGSSIDNNPAGTSTFTGIEEALGSIGSTGVLNVLGGRDYSAGVPIAADGLVNLGGGTFDAALSVGAGGTLLGFGTVAQAVTNGGTVAAAGGFLNLAGGVSDGGSVVVNRNATMALNGTFAQPIANDGAVQVENGTLTLNGAVSGSGGFVIGNVASQSVAATLVLGAGANQPVAFNGALGDLLLDAPANFNSGITGFGANDVIDLAGITADLATLSGSALNITFAGTTVDTLALSGNYGSAVFNAGTDGAGGTKITVSGVNPRDYNFERPYWQSKIITWSFATSNLTGDSSATFSSFFNATTQAAEAGIVEQALARWAAIAGFTFEQVPDSASVDIRVGWGDLLHSGLGEIGQASFKFSGNIMAPDGIVRIEDPVETALTSDPGVIGGLAYQGQSSTMYQIALHEIGHALGLAHSTDPNAVMFPTAQGATNQDADASDIAGMQALYAAVACYAAGSNLLTPRGEVAVERLQVGDTVVAVGARQLRRVRWIGSRHMPSAAPVRVRAGAFGPAAPHRDLLLSPDHAVCIAGALVPVRCLVNGASVAHAPARPVTWFHVELADAGGGAGHDVLLADGLPAESYLDTGNRAAFDDENPANNLAFTASRAYLIGSAR
jgi:hypothetical protein